MKKLLILLMVLAVSVFAEYSVGDNTADMNWEDSDGGAVVSQSIQNFVDNKIVLVMSWGYLG